MDITFFETNNEIIENTRLFFNTNKININKDIQILRDWLQKQPHLPQNISDNHLENIYIRNKCRLEVCKRKLDNYFSGKNAFEKLFDFSNFDISKSTVAILPLPDLYNGERICFLKNINSDMDLYKFEHFSKGFEIFSEISVEHDYCQGYQYVFDADGFSMGHILRIDVAASKEMAQMFFDGQSFRVSAIHIFNLPSFISIFMNIVKGLLPTKIFNRIKLHKNLDELCKEIPQKILPKNYGGNCPSLEELQEKWNTYVKDHDDLFAKNRLLKSNEQLRIGESKYYKEIEGLNGTFRKIEID